MKFLIYYCHIFLSILFVITWQNPISAQQQNLPPKQKTLADYVMPPVVYSVPGMDKVKITKDLIYKSEKAVELKMNVFTAPDLKKGERRPVVLLIHGTAGLADNPKDWGVFVSWGKIIAASGMTAVVYNHRIKKENFEVDLETAEADLTAAIDYIRKNAAGLNADENRIAVVAFSGGGPMLSVPMRENMLSVKALASFYGFLGIEEVKMFQRGNTAEILKKYSAVNYLKAEMPPIFIARAGQDIPDLNAALAKFVQAALEKNVALEIMNHPAGVHGFENQNNDARTKEIIQGFIEFLKTNIMADNIKANDNVKITEQLFELFNRHDWDAMTKLYSPEAEFLDPSYGTIPVKKTRTETAEKYREMAKIFPDIRDRIKNIYPLGENVILEFVSTGTAPDGKPFEMPICSILTFENGMIIRDRTYYDNPK